MAVITRYVNCSSTGGDGTTNAESGGTAAYSSLSASLAAEAGDLGPDSLEILCSSGTSNLPDTAFVNTTGITQWVTGPTSSVTIKPNVGQEHGGVWNENVYRMIPVLGVDDNVITNAAIDHLVLDGLQLCESSSIGSTQVLAFHGGIDSGFQHVKNCILRINHTDVNDTIEFCYVGDSTPKYYFENNIFFTAQTSQHNSITYAVRTDSSTTQIWFYNNTIVGKNLLNGINADFGSWNITNNIISGSTSHDIDSPSGQSVSMSYNATGDGSGTGSATAWTGSGTRINQTFYFNDASNDDYRLSYRDKGVMASGKDLSSDPDLPITTDITGRTRTPLSSMGAYQYPYKVILKVNN